MTAAETGAPLATEEGLHRGLNQRQLTMIAIGGAIGVGLFLGSTFTIGLAGPGVIVTYLIGAVIALIMAYALAKWRSCIRSPARSASTRSVYLSPWLGFAVRATYAFIQILAIGAEVTAVAIYFAFWFPGVAQWVWVALASIGLLVDQHVESQPVRRVRVLVRADQGRGDRRLHRRRPRCIVLGFGRRLRSAFDNLVNGPGGFLPHGWTGVWLALTLVITSYMGVEVIAVTAGEAQNPEQSIPRAMRTMVVRLILFYLLAISVMLMMTPWNQIAGGGGGIAGSPFVRAFTSVGIPYAAGVMNLVVISAALSSANSNLYSTTSHAVLAVAFGLRCRRGCRQVSTAGVPLRAVAVASAGMVVAILLAIFSPDAGFLALFGTAVAGMLFIWIVILLTYLRFRASLGPERVAALPIRLPAHRAAAGFGIVMLSAIVITTFFVDGLRYTVPSFLPFLAVISLFYARTRRRGRCLTEADVRRRLAVCQSEGDGQTQPGTGRRREYSCSAMISGSRFISSRMPGGKSLRLEVSGADTGDAVAAFADETVHVALVRLEEIPDAPFGQLLERRCRPRALPRRVPAIESGRSLRAAASGCRNRAPARAASGRAPETSRPPLPRRSGRSCRTRRCPRRRYRPSARAR